MSRKYLVCDLETYGHKTYKRFCNPLDPAHFVIMNSLKWNDEEPFLLYNKEGIPRGDLFKGVPLSEAKFLVGQNFKFDMLWFWDNPDFQAWLANGGIIWDTRLVEYLLRGQDPLNLNLDALATKYGGTVKDDRVKTMFEAGLTVLDIPQDLLKEYALADAVNTDLVFRGQYRAVKAAGQLPLIQIYNEHLLALTEMEYNGMYFNVKLAEQKIKTQELFLVDLNAKIQELVRPYWIDEVEFNPASNDHVAAVIFSQKLPYKAQVPLQDEEGEVVHYKTGARKGEIKTKWAVLEKKVPGFRAKAQAAWLGKKGLPKVNDAILQELRETASQELRTFMAAIDEYRSNNKLLSTYLLSEKTNTKGEVVQRTGLLAVVHPDGCIHTEFNPFLTRTGRLSSRNPNIQNLDPQILELFESRWGDDGVLAEFDYSQLEIVMQAWITQSPQMIQDLWDELDFHCIRLAYAEQMDYATVKQLCDTDPDWKLKRKKAKTISFQKAYGARPEKIAMTTKLPLEVVKAVFKAEDARYPEVPEFYRLMQEDVKATRLPTAELHPFYDSNDAVFTRDGEFKCYGHYYSPLRKRYQFMERAKLDRFGRVFRYWHTPELYDYPVQGTAADVIALAVGQLWREYLQFNRDKVLLVNEVHDSVVLDIKKKELDKVLSIVYTYLCDLSPLIEKKFGLKVNVPIRVDYNYGKSWKEAK